MSDDLTLMPPVQDGDDDLATLLGKRAPRKRSKLTTTLGAVLLVLLGVLLGVQIGRASAGPAVTPGGGFGPGSGQGQMQVGPGQGDG